MLIIEDLNEQNTLVLKQKGIACIETCLMLTTCRSMGNVVSKGFPLQVIKSILLNTTLSTKRPVLSTS